MPGIVRKLAWEDSPFDRKGWSSLFWFPYLLPLTAFHWTPAWTNKSSYFLLLVFPFSRSHDFLYDGDLNAEAMRWKIQCVGSFWALLQGFGWILTNTSSSNSRSCSEAGYDLAGRSRHILWPHDVNQHSRWSVGKEQSSAPRTSLTEGTTSKFSKKTTEAHEFKRIHMTSWQLSNRKGLE